jgi:hypothetical protein
MDAEKAWQEVSPSNTRYPPIRDIKLMSAFDPLRTSKARSRRIKMRQRPFSRALVGNDVRQNQQEKHAGEARGAAPSARRFHAG